MRCALIMCSCRDEFVTNKEEPFPINLGELIDEDKLIEIKDKYKLMRSKRTVNNIPFIMLSNKILTAEFKVFTENDEDKDASDFTKEFETEADNEFDKLLEDDENES